jgi:hypothetical protein
MRQSSACLLVFALLIGLTQSAAAGDRTETVKFKPGAISALKKGTVKGYDTVTYRLDAREGQVMQVLFSPSNRSCYFNASAPGRPGLVFDGTMSGNEYSANLEASGRYTFQVFLMRNAARRGEACKYTISFEISG